MNIYEIKGKSITRSLTSFFREECIPIKKGVGVERTSISGDGRSGMYM
jgi:hypothetical protein